MAAAPPIQNKSQLQCHAPHPLAMTAAPPTQYTPCVPVLDQEQWVIQIRRILDEENEDDTDLPVSIANVPKQLIAAKPEAYIPQEIALGPYHHWRPELYQMERYKIAASKRTQQSLNTSKFQTLVDDFLKLEPQIRSCYHHYLDYEGETLAWMMAIDASFLLEFLSISTSRHHQSLERSSSKLSHLVDNSGTKTSHNAILRDIMMFENQIPLFLLRKIVESQSSSHEESEKVLTNVLTELCKEISPFKAIDYSGKTQLTERAHLLELLHYVIVPQSNQYLDVPIERTVESEGSNQDQEGNMDIPIRGTADNEACGPEFLNFILGRLSSVNPLLSCVAQLFPKPPASSSKTDEPVEDGETSSNARLPPSIEEITIPSVSQLAKVGVKFSPTDGDLSTIRFDEKTLTLYLPAVTLDVNTEVILRNLVAFEASIACGRLDFTRYTELMNGIIDTAKDAKMLRERGIVRNCLKSDGEVANLWNGMSNSVRLTKGSSLDTVIQDVNRYYNSRWRVKVFGSWRFMTMVAAILLLAFSGLQSFCSVYTCSRVVRVLSKE